MHRVIFYCTQNATTLLLAVYKAFGIANLLQTLIKLSLAQQLHITVPTAAAENTTFNVRMA